jgi:hypothetical protein
LPPATAVRPTGINKERPVLSGVELAITGGIVGDGVIGAGVETAVAPQPAIKKRTQTAPILFNGTLLLFKLASFPG